MYFVYIISNKYHTVFYTGVTARLEERIHEHREHLVEGFTSTYNISKLLFMEPFPDPETAIKREKQLKGWSRKKKIELITKANPSWKDLFMDIVPPNGLIINKVITQ